MRPIEELHMIATIKVTVALGEAKELMTFYKKPMKYESCVVTIRHIEYLIFFIFYFSSVLMCLYACIQFIK